MKSIKDKKLVLVALCLTSLIVPLLFVLSRSGRSEPPEVIVPMSVSREPLYLYLTRLHDESLKRRRAAVNKRVQSIIDEKLDPHHPKVVQLLKKLIFEPPVGKKLSLTNSTAIDYSQLGQSLVIDNELNQTRNGFFVEAGGFDGEFTSNTLFFEMQRNWTGLLIEAHPQKFRQLQGKYRNVYALNACIADRIGTLDFYLNDVFSGLRAHHKYAKVRDATPTPADTIRVPCFPLDAIMNAIGQKHIDYLSLDIEGAELTVLNSINMSRVDIKALSVEYTNRNDTKNALVSYLKDHGYKLFAQTWLDLFFIK